MKYYNDEVLFWRNYESQKDKVFIDFNKNKKLKKKFIKLIQEMKLKTITDEVY